MTTLRFVGLDGQRALEVAAYRIEEAFQVKTLSTGQTHPVPRAGLRTFTEN